MDDMKNMSSYAQNDPELQQFLKQCYNVESPQQKLQRLDEENRDKQKNGPLYFR